MKIKYVKLYIISILIFFTQIPIVFAQITYISGKVTDEEGVPIKGVLVFIDDAKMHRTTDIKGTFGYEIKGKIPQKVHIEKKGYTYKTHLFDEKSKKITITIQKGDEWSGTITEGNGQASVNSKIIFTKVNPNNPRSSNKSGNFTIVTTRGLPSADFGAVIVNDKPIAPSDVIYEETLKRVNIKVNPLQPTKQEKEVVKQTEKAKENNKTNKPDSKTDSKDNKTSKPSVINKENPPQLTTDGEQVSLIDTTSVAEIDAQTLAKYREQLNNAVKELDEESIVLRTTNVETKRKIKEIIDNIIDKDTNLPKDSKDKLREELMRLRGALVENVKDYKEIQMRSEELIALLTRLLAQKDSLENLSQKVSQSFDSLKVENKKSAEVYQRNLTIISLVAFFSIVLTIMAYFFIKREQKRKAELAAKNEEINQINEELTLTLETVQLQKDDIDSKNKKITDSLIYAQRIQKAILPHHQEISQHFSDYFILYQPKDIVSGDFYFFAQVPATESQNEKLVLAVVDCTGHGVPGAFMSIIGNEVLNEIVNGRRISSPDLILRELHDGIYKGLHQNETESKDGMDLSILVIDKQAGIAEFAGAKTTIIYMQNEQLSEIKGDRIPIGGYSVRPKNFNKHQIPLLPNGKTMFYLFSDGYQDQFGGVENKKFMYPRLKNLLSEIYQKDTQSQQIILKEQLDKWIATGKRPQIDDILVMGIRV